MPNRIGDRHRRAPRLWRAFLVAATIPAVLIAVSLWLTMQFEGFLDSQRNLQQTYRQQAAIAALISDMKDAETAHRGFVITGDPAFLEPYLDSRMSVGARVEALERLFATEDAAIRRRIARIGMLVPQKFGEMQRVLDVHRREGLPVAARAIAQGHGKELMDEIRLEAGAIERRQDAYLAGQVEVVEREADSGRYFYLLAVAVIAVISFIVAYFLWSASRARHRAMLDAIDAGARQTAIFNSTLNAIILINPSGSIEVMNPAAERLFGYPATDLLRRDISIVADIAPGEGSFLDRIGLTEEGLAEPFRPVLQARRSGGATVAVEVALGLMPLEDGMHIVAVFGDITEREKLEEIKDQFLSTVSHELRTPLTSIVGSLGLLKAGVADELSSQQQRLVDIAENNAHRLIRIVNDILDAEKLQSGQMAFTMAPIDLREAATSAVAGMNGLAATKDIILSVVAPDEPVAVQGDNERLVQVVNNLLSNAIKFSPPGSRVDVAVSREGSEARVAVADQGPGIPIELRARLFTRFAQASGAAYSGTPGTGLGLTISREILRHHGGTLSFSDGASGGTVFLAAVPLSDRPLAQEELNCASRLLLYAEAKEAEALTARFEAKSIRADRIESVDEAIGAVKQRHYLAMIVDFQLAGDAAPALIQAVRAEPRARGLPIIGIAPEGSPVDPGDMAAIDIIDWLPKPVATQQLDEAIANAMARAAVDTPLVLHVDDDRDTLDITAAALNGHARVRQASDLASARAFLAEHRPDILIIDIALPDGSGLDLVTDMAGTDRAGTPVIIYTAQDRGGDLREVEAVLTKSKKTLPSLVETILAIRERQEREREK